MHTEALNMYTWCILLSFAVMQGQDGQAEGSRYNAGYGASSISASAARYVYASVVHEARLLPPHPVSLLHVLILLLWLKVVCLVAVPFETCQKAAYAATDCR